MHRLLFPALLLSTAALAQPAAPDALDGFAPGRWSANPIGGSGVARSACLAAPEDLLMAGRPMTQCSVTRISSDATSSVVTWKCNGTSGRTAIRRDSEGLYTVDIQGIESGLPFAERAEWKKIGAC